MLRDFFQTMQFDVRQEKVSYPSDRRAFVLLNERQVTIYEHVLYDELEVREERTVYEYDGLFLDVAAPNAASVLSALKQKQLEELKKYDSSDKVNRIMFRGEQIWFDKATRNGLLMRLNAEQQAGIKTTTLWYGNSKSYTLDVEDAVTMLYAIERYASQCYDNTQRHAKAISELFTEEEMYNYDFTTGYPEVLVFE